MHIMAMTVNLRVSPLVFLIATIVCVPLSAAGSDKQGQPEIAFETHIAPILKRHCFSCHSGAKPKAGLDLTTRRGLLRGSRSGAVVRQAAAESSLLWERIAAGEMPPKGRPLTSTEKGLIRTWINRGAPGSARGEEEENGQEADRSVTSSHVGEEDRSFWSFQPPQRVPLPQTQPADRIANAIDSFLARKLVGSGLSFSDEANRLTLIRRLNYDLLGLPPSPEQVTRFVSDRAPDAYSRLVDRLLASPRYGERWGRHWLDLAGYADSAGILNEDRVLPLAYRYRDYVIRALNADKPYDRFLQEQIAGDELTEYWHHFESNDQLPDEVIEGLTATGFLRCAADSSRPDFANIKNAESLYFYPTINDTIQIVATTTMGLTLQCARCHDHMFDPISQEDFYRIQAIFMGAFRPTQWIPQMERRLKIATRVEQETARVHNAKLETQIKELQQRVEQLKQRYADRLLEDRLSRLPPAIRPRVRSAFATAEDERTADQQELVRRFQPRLRPRAKQLVEVLTEEYPSFETQLKPLNEQISEHQRKKIQHDEIRALYDLPGEVRTPFLRRGDALTPSYPVEPGILSVLQHTASYEWRPSQRGTRTSLRRLAFARWLTARQHPLTARVLVNRLWLHHFGEGIVDTPGDFGRAGSAPSHPALLDWLARELVESGWSIKHLHRLMLTSTAYRQSTHFIPGVHAKALQVDPDNRLLWRQRMRRLEAESLRDSVFRVAGTLNEQMFGPPIPMQRRTDGEVTTADGHDPFRRSIYLQIRRLTPLTMLQNFDQPNMETNCIRRSRSTVATQALTLLNSNSMVAAAGAFANRVFSASPRETIDRAIWLAYSRPPQQEEYRILADFLQLQAERHVAELTSSGTDQNRIDEPSDTTLQAQRAAVTDLCHMLLSANEFIYLD